jgi:heme/copper-type cytochrome/quinol oxidase subunit 2
MRNRRFLVVAAVGIVFMVTVAFLVFGHAKRPAEHRTFTVSIVGTAMTPSTLVAYDGDTVTIIVSADKTEEIHLHGYNFFFDAQPGAQMVKTFPADKEGAFTIEIEGSTLSNGIRLGELDVYPS